MKVYLTCSRVNREVAQEVGDFLKKNGYDVYVPIVETPQEPKELMFKTNIKEIENADTIVAVAKGNITQNWTFEIGYALGLNKNIICLIHSDNDLHKHEMTNQAILKVSSLEELKGKLGELT